MERRHVGKSLEIQYGRISDEVGVAENLVCERRVGNCELWASCGRGRVGGDVSGSVGGGTDWRWHRVRDRGCGRDCDDLARLCSGNDWAIDD